MHVLAEYKFSSFTLTFERVRVEGIQNGIKPEEAWMLKWFLTENESLHRSQISTADVNLLLYAARGKVNTAD